MAVILIIFLRTKFYENADFVHCEDERTAGTLLVVFKMPGLQEQKTGVSIKIQENEHICMFAIIKIAHSNESTKLTLSPILHKLARR